MLEYDKEIVARIEHLVDRVTNFKSLRITQEGLDRLRTFHHDEIERRCAEQNYAAHPYIELYENMANNNLEKKCVRRTFPDAIPEKCEKLCRGYDKFCAEYVPTERFDFSEISDMLDYRDANAKYPPQKP